MGGQACVFYGAAEFSRDLDLLIVTDPDNLDRLKSVLTELEANAIAVPPFDTGFLKAGHALHFRCSRADVAGLRIDIMSRLRGVAEFSEVWERRTTIETDGETIDILGLPDLVVAKKTQLDKDWPMIRRLVEQSYFQQHDTVDFWLRELRTPELLIRAVTAWPAEAARTAQSRPAVAAALNNDLSGTTDALRDEERDERERDRLYWEPLRRELEQLRFEKRKSLT
jgi:hypothetical protein